MHYKLQHTCISALLRSVLSPLTCDSRCTRNIDVESRNFAGRTVGGGGRRVTISDEETGVCSQFFVTRKR